MSRRTFPLTINAYDADDEDARIEVTVEFSTLAPEPDVGIFGWGSEDHTLLDPKTGVRLIDLEKKVDDAGDWDSIAEQINERSGEWA